VQQLELAETVEALRAELARAAEAGSGAGSGSRRPVCSWSSTCYHISHNTDPKLGPAHLLGRDRPQLGLPLAAS